MYAAKDLPRGRARPVRVMSEDFTLYRGESGTAYLIGARCAHRRTQLSTGWVEGDDIRCLYHGWKYDGTGQCNAAPPEKEGFYKRIKIRGYPVREYLGLIFAYIGPGEPPELPQYLAFEEDGLLDSYMQRCPWNYFLNVENMPDEVHVSFVHRDSVYGERGMSDLPTIRAEETEWGLVTYATRSEGRVRSTLHGQPNIGSWAASPRDEESGWRHAISWRVPIDDNEHWMFNVFLVQVTGEAADRLRRKLDEWAALPNQIDLVAKEVLRGELDVQELQHDPRLVNRQHVVNAQDQVAQEGQGDVDRSLETLGRSDAGLALLRRIWRRELEAFAKGEPGKQWRRPVDLNPMVGN